MEKLDGCYPSETLSQEYRNLLEGGFCSYRAGVAQLSRGLGDEAIEEISNFEPELFWLICPKNVLIASHSESDSPSFPHVNAGCGRFHDSMFLIEMMRLGVKEFLPRPASAERLKEACQRIYKSIYSQIREKHPATILSFFGSQGEAVRRALPRMLLLASASSRRRRC
jgi:hypothetical protein